MQNRCDQNNEELQISRSVIKIYPFFLKQFHEETKSAWQAFMAFLAVHAIFLGFLLDSFIKEKSYPSDNNGLVLTVAGVAGFLLCLLWLYSFLRYRNVVRFRMAQAKSLEFREGPGLFRGDGEKFSNGETIWLDDEPFAIGCFLRTPLTNFAYPAIIAIFALTYLFIILRLWLDPCAVLIIMIPIIAAVVILFVSLVIHSFTKMRSKKDPKPANQSSRCIKTDQSSPCIKTKICFIPIVLMLVALILHVRLFPFLTLQTLQKRKD